MIYLLGGAPRVGKSILGQRVSAKLKISWISTDLLEELLRLKNEAGVKMEWNADPEAISAAAEWSFPYLERFIWGVHSMAEAYLVEGVDFLPAQVAQLSTQYPIRSVFLGCSKMTPEKLDQFPGRSQGYAFLPEAFKRQIVQDVPHWSEFIRQEAGHFSMPYVDMSADFHGCLDEAEAVLTGQPTSGQAR